MDLINEIKGRLAKYPNAKYECDDSSISVLPGSETGFSVGLTVSHDVYTVSFEGWHEDFNDENEALECFAFGLSDECRLRESRRGNVAYKWTVEFKEDGKWIEQGTTGLLLFPFWARQEVRYLQNNLITSAQ